jgi:Tfp pilus assembly protein PilN
MIEINLLPGGVRKKASAAGKSVDFAALFAGLNEKLGDKVLLGSVVVTVLAVGTGGYLYYRATNDRTVAEARLEKAKEDSVRYSRVVAARTVAMAKRDTVLRQVNLIRAIDDDRYIWPHIMDEVSNALPNYVWIAIMSNGGVQGATNVVAAPPAPKPKPVVIIDSNAPRPKPPPPPKLDTGIPRDQITVRLTGRTVDVQAMTRFMADLEASPYFANVFNERTTPTNESGVEYYQFQLIINYTRPDSTAVRRVPLLSTARR